MDVRASHLGAAAICPGVLLLYSRHRSTGTAYTGAGHIGHKWMEWSILGRRAEADALVDDVEFLSRLHEFWSWLVESELLPQLEPGPGLHLEELVEWQITDNVRLTGHMDYRWGLDDRLVVADWKFYNNPAALPPIIEDRQMLAYGCLALGGTPEAKQVTVYRILPYYFRVDALEIDRATMYPLALAALKEEVTSVYERRGQFFVGAQCETCLLSGHCSEYAKSADGIDTEEISVYRGGELESADDALRYLLAIKQVEARLDECTRSLKGWVVDNGPIMDPVSGKRWGPWPTRRDKIVKPEEVIRRLYRLAGPSTLEQLNVTKKAMETLMKQNGMKPADRREFIDDLRKEGLIERTASTEWGWRAPRKDRAK